MATTEQENAILQRVTDSKEDAFGKEPERSNETESETLSNPDTDKELGSDLDPHGDAADPDYDLDDEDDFTRSNRADAKFSSSKGAVGAWKSRLPGGSANTGPKGVIRDSLAKDAADRRASAQRIRTTNDRLKAMSFQAETWDEAEARRKREKELEESKGESDDEEASARAIAELKAREQRREQRIAELRAGSINRSSSPLSAAGGPRGLAGGQRWFGHLREVDQNGYVAAIDQEDPSVPVVIHIYGKSVEACAALTFSLSSLARQYPLTKFLQVRATSIGFGGGAGGSLINKHHGRGHQDDDDHYDEDDDDDDDILAVMEKEESAAEVLPTLLVYKGGQLVANLVRVDLDDGWKGGSESAVRDILSRYDALRSSSQPQTKLRTDSSGSDDD
ncbi:thioredoxin-like protein [Violaceomyces palustris]|uniref:Thioredoxin-like protein n=1 Tax=Violaceomyces palustris TaxID=1673888 RepID=A0ACD0NYZ1_9BASI|nr:thioredoxin-like protein [Violaceomyces palustris]